MPDAEEIWQKSLKKIEQVVSKPSFEGWIKTLKPLELKGDSLILEAPNRFTAEHVKRRFAKIIENVLYDLLGKSVNIEVHIAEGHQEENEAKVEDSFKEEIDYQYYGLNPKYVFETFVIGKCNKLAHAAALAVAESPGRAYNPLFIYGGVGLGKTHLMHAIAHYVLKRNPKTKVVYVSSEKFTNELINAIRDDSTNTFRRKYRNVDILLIDDIQFLSGKEGTQEEFFHTFNTLYEANKQIVISSDRPPKEIPDLEDRLVSRFEWGLLADIQPPEFETRVAILKKKMELEKIYLPEDVVIFIAENFTSNIRELEGALIKVVAHFSLHKDEDITVEKAAGILRDILPVKKKTLSIEDIKNAVALEFEISLGDLVSEKKAQEFSLPRQIAMYLAREYTNLSLQQIGKEFRKKDHTTVIHAHRKIGQLIKSNPEVKRKIERICGKLGI
ncbi:MAG: chromosomal replication initiator protein DnaA [Synergistetes bacterium]|nr:chromosomal replication initiator protein DnaA [Synergistota bacterium]MDW8191769.1 chromosomal replication initiator protein DnaA [Synergistota bacterium]